MKYSAIQSRRETSVDHVFVSEPYLRLTEAIRQDDVPRAGAIIAEQIAATVGEEHFFWLGMQVSARLRYAKTALERLEHWPAVIALGREAGADPDRQKRVIGQAFVVLLDAERVPELARFCLSLRPGFALYQRQGWAYQFNRGFLHRLHGRWERMHVAFTRSLEAFLRLPDMQQSPTMGNLINIYAERSVAAAMLGRLESARADLREAMQVEQRLPGERRWVTYIAEAELSLLAGEVDRARTLLQGAAVRLTSDGFAGYPRARVRMELLAARLARATGNMASFHHFAARALAIATEHELKLSEAEVRRIIDGALH